MNDPKRENPPREWWIAEKSQGDNEYMAVDIQQNELINIPPEHHGVHVIEYSAYQSAMEERDKALAEVEKANAAVKRRNASLIEKNQEIAEARAELDLRAKPTVRNLREQLASLKSENERLKEVIVRHERRLGLHDE